jgi:predicted nucleic-acid-binding protein
MKTGRFVFSVPVELMSYLKDAAKNSGVSIAEYVRLLVERDKVNREIVDSVTETVNKARQNERQ